MAICFVRASVIGRSGGRSATAAAAYRAGEKIMDDKTRRVHDYTRKQGVDYSEIISPIAASDRNSWMHDRSTLWNKVELGEKRVDAQVAREIIIAIPRELDRGSQIALVREYVQSSYVDRGMIADINCHHLDSNNPHAHVMLSMRELQIDEHGTVGFGNKDRSWNKKELLEKQLHEWEVVVNKYLERAGIETRIDARSYEEQGIERIAQIHLGAVISELMKKGIETSVSVEYNRINLANAEIQSRLEEIYKLELAIGNLNGQPENSDPQISDPKIGKTRINRNPAFLEKVNPEVLAKIEGTNKKPNILTSDQLMEMVGEDRAKRFVQWAVKNIVIPNGQTEIQIKSRTHAVTIAAIDIDRQTIAYVFADERTEDQLKITCSKSSGSILSMTGSMIASTTGSIYQQLIAIDIFALKEMLGFSTKKEPGVELPEVQISIPEVDKAEIVTPEVQISIPEVDKAEIVTPEVQISIPEVDKAELPINRPTRRVVNRGRSHEMG